MKGLLRPYRSVLARAEGEMTRLPEFSDCVMLVYGMDGDVAWGARQTRFLKEVYVGDMLETKYIIRSKTKTEMHGILGIDYEIGKHGKLAITSRGNLYHIK